MIFRVATRLWNSPTFTTWGKQAAEALRMLAVTPLILVRFDTTEIAAWYLFGSLMFFGSMIQGRMSLTFSRMIAFGMGGATDLAPIRDGAKRKSGNGEPNWAVIARAYGTIGALNALLAVLVGVLALGMGYYGLQRMVGVHPRPGDIWAAFGIVVGSQTFIFAYKKYEVALKGMNYVALINRWSTLFSLLSVVGGFTALSLGANIWQLALTMQSVLLLDILRMRLLLRFVEDGRARSFPPFRIDREVLSWAWPPFWKGFVTNISQEGVVQFALVLFARHGDPVIVASFLFSYRILRVIGRIANAPFSSHMPKLSRLIAQNDDRAFGRLLIRQIFQAQALLAAGIVLGGVGLYLVLPMIGANISFLDLRYWFLLGLIFIVHRFLVLTRAAFELGNAFPFLKLEVTAGLIALGAVITLVPTGNLWAVILAPLAPSIILINLVAIRRCARFIEIPPMQYLRRTSLWLVLGYLVAAAVVLTMITPERG
ncbi:MAG: hypothetical protein JJU00_19450 [Opitutales bacterium]|nr:hypothetical protein [Opitutales bacterium]